MVGHPTETDDDVQAIVDFTLAARRHFKRRIAINATPFVPKAHTPFQWEGMAPAKTIRRRQKHIYRSLARHGVEVRADSPDWAEVQAVLSRGDRRLAQLLLAIPSGGLTVRSFFQAMDELGLDKEAYIGKWEVGSPLPWDVNDPEPVARMICVLLSDWASQTTGEVVRVDGGFPAAVAPAGE